VHVTECLVGVLYTYSKGAQFFRGWGHALGKIIGSSGLLPDYITCNYNRLAMLRA